MILSIVIFEDRRIDAEILIYVILYNSHLIGVYGVLLAFDRRQLRDLAVLYDKPALVGVRVKVLFGKFLADFVHVCVLEYRAQSGDVPDYRAVAYRGKLSLILRVHKLQRGLEHIIALAKKVVAVCVLGQYTDPAQLYRLALPVAKGIAHIRHATLVHHLGHLRYYRVVAYQRARLILNRHDKCRIVSVEYSAHAI